MKNDDYIKRNTKNNSKRTRERTRPRERTRTRTRTRPRTRPRPRTRARGGGRIVRSGGRIVRSIGNNLARVMGSKGSTGSTGSTDEDKSFCISIFITTRDKLRELFNIVDNPSYDTQVFDPLDPFPYNELPVDDEFIKRDLINMMCYGNLPEKYKKTFKAMLLAKYQNNTDYFKQFYYRASLGIKRLLPHTSEIHPLKEYNFCGPGTDVAWRLGGEIVLFKRLMDNLLDRNEIGTFPYDKSIDEVDDCCRVHDLMFGTQYIGEGDYTHNTETSEAIADSAMLECLKKKKERGLSINKKGKLIETTIRAKHGAQKSLRAFGAAKTANKLNFAASINPEAPFNKKEYQMERERMVTAYNPT